MASKKKKHVTRSLYKQRVFINPISAFGMAAIRAVVSTTEHERSTSVEANLTISDCSEVISLEFDVYSSSQDVKYLAARRKKLKILRTTINAFLDATEEAYKAHEAHQKRTAKKKKKDND